jgi:maltose O-acetyltransferase
MICIRKLVLYIYAKEKGIMTLNERNNSGKLFTNNGERLPEDRVLAKRRMIAFNTTGPDTFVERVSLMRKIFGKEIKAWIEPPFYFYYGTNIEIGENSYINFNCNFIDAAKIIIGKNVMFGADVTIDTVDHPINSNYRVYMHSDSVKIEDNCWIGANVMICHGVTIGENSVIGEGSVVTKDIQANSVAVGNPCKVVRSINENDINIITKMDRYVRKICV